MANLTRVPAERIIPIVFSEDFYEFLNQDYNSGDVQSSIDLANGINMAVGTKYAEAVVYPINTDEGILYPDNTVSNNIVLKINNEFYRFPNSDPIEIVENLQLETVTQLIDNLQVKQITINAYNIANYIIDKNNRGDYNG